MKRFRLVLCLLLATMMLLFATGCSKESADTNGLESPTAVTNGSETQASAEPSEGESAGTEVADPTQLGYWPGTAVPDGIQPGTVINASIVGQDFPTHLPYLNISHGALHVNMYDSLFYVYQNDYNDIRGALVESWDFAEDMLSVVMKVREGVTFTNGNPLTAQSIVDCYTKYTSQYQQAAFANIESMEATGEYEMTFKFKTYYPNFIYKFCVPETGVVDPKAIEEFGPEDNRSAIGTGPYYIESYSAGEKLVLKANPNYYLPEKAPHIETINIMVIPNSQTAVSAFISGDLNWMKTQSVVEAQTIEDSGQFQNVAVVPAPPQPFFINMKHNAILQNPKVREALAKMIDWQGICDLVFNGKNTPLTSIWSEGTAGWVDASEYYYYNPEEALQILQDAGVDPKDITVEYLTSANYADLATALQAQLAQYGVTLKINQVEPSSMVANIQSGDWDTVNIHGGYSATDIIKSYSMGLAEGAMMKFVWFDAYDQELQDKLIDLYNKAASAPTYEEQCEYCREITALCQENYATLGGYQANEFVCHADNVRNIVMYSLTGYPEFCYSYIED